MVELRFRTNALRRNFEDTRRAERAWGRVVGNKYNDLLTIIQSLPSFNDIYLFPRFRAHPLRGNRQGHISLTLTGRWRLIVAHDQESETVTVIEVSNHYGD